MNRASQTLLTGAVMVAITLFAHPVPAAAADMASFATGGYASG